MRTHDALLTLFERVTHAIQHTLPLLALRLHRTTADADVTREEAATMHRWASAGTAGCSSRQVLPDHNRRQEQRSHTRSAGKR